jgi:hypothetical protein
MAPRAPPQPPLLPARAWSADDVAAAPYDMGDLAGPPLAGRPLALYRALCEARPTAGPMFRMMLARNAVPRVCVLGGL